MPDKKLQAAVSLPSNFSIAEVVARVAGLHPAPAPSLGPLADFVGDWAGSGFNTIFRPDSTRTPTPLPVPVSGSDNVLELNLTTETLSFSSSLGSVPNRGLVQGDVFLNGVPYLQTVNDVTIHGQSVGIHLEPGLWVVVPQTTDPAEGQTVVRMGSIPHGTTILAQGTSSTLNGPPTIAPVDITPFFTATKQKQPFPSQNAAAGKTARIPQDLTSYIAAGTITQAILDDPNTVLRNAISGQKIVHTTTLSVSTSPANPLFGGGAENIAFLLGDAAATRPNAQTLMMIATFWIETVEHDILVPAFKPGHPPLILQARGVRPGALAPNFLVHPPTEITAPRTIKVMSRQIQYSQLVMLNFNTLTWPHVSVATLVPNGAIPVPPTVW
jgi:hypothetical protein